MPGADELGTDPLRQVASREPHDLSPLLGTGEQTPTLEALQVRAGCLRDDTMGRSVLFHGHAAGRIAKEDLNKRDLPVVESEVAQEPCGFAQLAGLACQVGIELVDRLYHDLCLSQEEVREVPFILLGEQEAARVLRRGLAQQARDRQELSEEEALAEH